MQKVGKLDETKDEVFDEFVSNFNKQQVRLQPHFPIEFEYCNYILYCDC